LVGSGYQNPVTFWVILEVCHSIATENFASFFGQKFDVYQIPLACPVNDLKIKQK
jgi:hypothetical protein